MEKETLIPTGKKAPAREEELRTARGDDGYTLDDLRKREELELKRRLARITKDKTMAKSEDEERETLKEGNADVGSLFG